MSGARLKVKSAKYIPNHAGLAQHMEGPEVQSSLKRRGKKIIDAYDPKMSGADKSKWTFVESDSGSSSVLAGTRFPLAHLDEWGSINNPPYGSMRRAVGRAGFKYKPKSKGS